MKNRFYKLLKNIEFEKSNSKKWLMSKLLITYFYNMDIKDRKEVEKDMDKLLLHLEVVDTYDGLVADSDMHLSVISKVVDRFYESDFEDYNLYPNNKVDFKYCDEITSEILNDIDPKAYSLYKELQKTGNIVIKDQDKMGYCINGLGIDLDYISLDKKNDKMVTFIWCLVHEIGHTYENNYMSNMSSAQQIFRYYYIFAEVLSTFFARVGLDYMIKNRIYLDDSERLLNSHYYDLMYSYLNLDFILNAVLSGKCVHDLSNYQIVDFNCYEDYKEKEKRYEVIPVESDTYNEYIIYGYGSLLSEYFLNIYKEDKKEGLKQIKNFLSNQALLDDRQMLESINFFSNDFKFLEEELNKNHDYMRNR